MSGNPLASLQRMRVFLSEGFADPANLAEQVNASLQASGQGIQSALHRYQNDTKQIADQAIAIGAEVIQSLEEDSSLQRQCIQEGRQIVQSQEEFGKVAEAAKKALEGGV
jgi:hypothetical protein